MNRIYVPIDDGLRTGMFVIPNEKGGATVETVWDPKLVELTAQHVGVHPAHVTDEQVARYLRDVVLPLVKKDHTQSHDR